MQRELDDIEKEIERATQLLSITADDHPTMQLLLTQLGECHKGRYDILGELGDIDKAIENTSTALTLAANDDPGTPDLLETLGACYGRRFLHLSKTDDIEEAIKYLSWSVSSTPEGHSDLPRRLTNLGVSHTDRFQRLGELKDIEKAIEFKSRALGLIPNGDPDLSSHHGSLGASYKERFEHLGELGDLEEAIKCQSLAIILAPHDYSDLPNQFSDLGSYYDARFRRLGEPIDLEKAIKYGSYACTLTPGDHPDLPAQLNNLGVFYSHRFERLGNFDDLEKEIEYKLRAVALTPDSHPDLSARLTNLGVSYHYRYKRLGDMGDLQSAIEYTSRAVTLIPEGHSGLPIQLSNLGMSHRQRFKRLGELDDLEKAIDYDSHALALTPVGHSHRSARLADLGVSYEERFLRLGELEDLKKAIEYNSYAVGLIPDGHPDLPSRLDSLGGSYLYRFRHLGGLYDLEKAIECGSRALELTPEGHPDIPDRLNNLGLCYRNRFEHINDTKDIEKAIEYDSLALALTPEGHIHLSGRLTNLALSHRGRFQCLDELEDLKKADQYQSQALALTPDGHPGSALIYVSLGDIYFLQFRCSGDPAYLQRSLESFRKASQSSTGAPRDRFRYAHGWARLASSSGQSSLNYIEAYQTTIDLLPQFIWLGATTNQRYGDLSTTENLAIGAASAAILASKYGLALEWLEHARCIVWNQSLMLRSPLNQLQSAHPNLGTRLQTVAKRLHDVGSESRESHALPSDSVTSEQVAREHRHLAHEYNDLLSQARKLPGFEDFLQPTKAERLVHVARIGPIVVINCDEDRCDALVILPGQADVKHIPLLTFTEEKAKHARSEVESSLRQKGLRERGVKIREDPGHKGCMGDAMAMLWNDLIEPILDSLGYLNKGLIEHLPHITWCPTGALSFLPLHAAGDYDQPGARIFEYAISSYTPNLTALLTINSSALNHNSQVLAIGQAITPGHSPLPGINRELACVKAHIRDKFKYSQLTDDQATTNAVLDAMEQHDWVHLACHAHQNVEDPTKSGFFLHDGTLDLASINRRSLKGKGLAFLSACQTATGDEKLPDEAVHLASGMLMAGYSSVIATMWSVVDEDAPLIADKVYGQLMKDGKVGNGEAGRALHDAVAELRGKVGEKAFERWVPYIHVGS